MATDAKQHTRINPAIHQACKEHASQNNTTLYHVVERCLINNLILPNDPDLAKKLADGLEKARELSKTVKRDRSRRGKLPGRLDRKDVLSNIAGNQKVIAVDGGVMAGVVAAAKSLDRYAFELVEDTLIMNIISPLDKKLAIDVRDTIHEARTRKLMRTSDINKTKDDPPINIHTEEPCEGDYPPSTIRLIVTAASGGSKLTISPDAQKQA